MDPMTADESLEQIEGFVEHVKRNHPADLGRFLDSLDTLVQKHAAEGRFQLKPPTRSPDHVVKQSIPGR